MTGGASQGLFVIVAVVIFGIFVLISYLLFRDNLKTGLGSIFEDSINTVDMKHFKNQLSTFNVIETNAFGWDKSLNGTKTLLSVDTSKYYWGTGYNEGVKRPEVGYHAHINTEKFGEPVMVFNNTNHLIDPSLKNRWLGYPHTWFENTDMIKDLKTSKTLEGRFDMMSDTVGGTIRFQLIGRNHLNETFYFDDKLGISQVNLKASKENTWESFKFTIPINEDMRDVKSISMYLYGHVDDEGKQSIKYVKNVKFGTYGTRK